MVLKVRLLVVEVVLGIAVLLTGLVDELVALATVLNGVLPLQIEGVPLGVEAFELLCGLVELDLGGLSLGDLLLELLGLAGHLDGELLDVEGQLLDFGLVGTSVLLEGEVVLFLLSGGEGPLFELLLVPVHLELELVHLLVGLEDHVLDVVEAVLLVGHPLVQLLDLVFEAAALALGHLLQVLLRLDLLVLDVHQALGVDELHLH